MNKVAVIDYGMGNLHSVAKAVEHVAGGDLRLDVTADQRTIREADRLIFPGVGAIRDCMAEIRRLGVDDMLREAAESKPILAICVGMQALMTRSDENDGVDCIGLVPGNVRRFAEDARDEAGERLKVPHMGWNNVRQVQEHSLWHGIEDDSRFYFVHSYYVEPASREATVGEADYPGPFCAALAWGNIFAVQFHPEKSQDPGLALLANFLRWKGGA